MFAGYEEETLDEYNDDDGTMPDNVDLLRDSVVGHRIVSARKETVPGRYYTSQEAFVITLDNGKKVVMRDIDDCCAYTELETFLLHADKVDHVITGVGTTNGFTNWHIFADFGDVLELTVGWSSGNPFYYSYGFDIEVTEIDE